LGGYCEASETMDVEFYVDVENLQYDRLSMWTLASSD